MNISRIPSDWRRHLADQFEQPYFSALSEFLEEERAKHTIYPPEDQVFAALEHTPYTKANVLILGQDPYHGPNQAHGLAFSVRPGVKPPPSLVNIFKELKNDLDCPIPNNGSLVSWADQGVLLLNAVLTVRAGEPNSHKNKGWEKFTDTVISRLSGKESEVVFVLWGNYAQKKLALIDAERHTIVQAAHPSPLSARHGFFGSRPFSKINEALQRAGKPEIDWKIPDR